MRAFKNIILGISNLIYPKTCRVCKKSFKFDQNQDFVCSACWQNIKLNTPPFCFKCGRRILKNKTVNNTCFDCMNKVLHFDRAFSPCLYDGVIKELLHAFKYKNMDYLGPTLAKQMISFIREYNFPIQDMDFIIPVPLFKTKLREREFNQASILARYIGKEFNKEISERILFRHVNTRTQVELDDHERLSNVRGAFSINDKSGINNKNILLIDDVLTTGATCSEAALTLKESGAKTVLVLTLAN